jgi:hypothetical protein
MRPDLSVEVKNARFDFTMPGYDGLFDWNPDSLAKDVVQWLNDPSASITKKFGMLACPNFQDLLNSYGFGDGFGAAFQKMMFTGVFIYTASNRPYPMVEDMKLIGALSGQEWLELLEKQLKPHILASRTKEHLQLLFLLVFGTVLAVGYTIPLDFEDPIYVCRAFVISIYQHC